MNQLRFLLLTTLILLSASRLPGQSAADWEGQVVGCDDGTISFSVARAYGDLNFLVATSGSLRDGITLIRGKH